MCPNNCFIELFILSSDVKHTVKQVLIVNIGRHYMVSLLLLFILVVVLLATDCWLLVYIYIF
jgi:hypothetical protein